MVSSNDQNDENGTSALQAPKEEENTHGHKTSSVRRKTYPYGRRKPSEVHQETQENFAKNDSPPLASPQEDHSKELPEKKITKRVKKPVSETSSDAALNMAETKAAPSLTDITTEDVPVKKRRVVRKKPVINTQEAEIKEENASKDTDS